MGVDPGAENVVVNVSVSDIFLLPVLIGYTLWWTYDLRKGTEVHGWTLMLHIIVYGLAAFYVWAVSLGEIVLAGGSSNSVSWVSTLILSAVGVTAAEIGIWYGEQRMVVERRTRGGFAYRGPILIALLWLGLYLTRFGIEDGLLGGYSVFLPPGIGPPVGISLGAFIEGILVVASLYLVSFGFLLGITLAIWHKHRRSVEALRSAAGPGPTVIPAPGGDLLDAVGIGAPAGPGPALEALATPSAGPNLTACAGCGQTWIAGTSFCGRCGHSLGLPPARR